MKTKINQLVRINQYKTVAAIFAIGLGSGFFSFLMHEWVEDLGQWLGTQKQFGTFTTLGALAFALTSFFLTKYFFVDTGGSGIPQVKLSLAAHRGWMPRRMPFGKFLTSSLTLSTGLSLGKEGPLVTVSAAWGHLVAHLFNLNRQITKNLVAAGATAGLAAAFNTPIAAVVFTIEEIVGELKVKNLVSIVLTSVIASVTSYKLLGNKATFIHLNYRLEEDWHLLLCFLLGLIMAFVGLMLVKSLLYLKSVKKKYFFKYDYSFVIFAVFLVAIFSQYSTEVIGDGAKTINFLLSGSEPQLVQTLLFLLVVKVLLVSTAYATGLSGGLFMPVLFLGAVGGTLFGQVLHSLGFQNVQLGVYALLGMTSLLVSVIRAPFTAFVMLFEMTRDYELILPLMLSSVAAYWMSGLFNEESVYESVAEYEGVHLPTHADREVLNEWVVEECMVRYKNVICLQAADRLQDIIEEINKSPFSGFPVVADFKLVGVVNKYELRKAHADDPLAPVKSAAKFTAISIYPDQSLLVALDKMKRFGISRLPVVSRINDKQLIGLITPEDIIKYLGISKKSEDAKV